MQVEGAAAENGANVQQWGTADGVTHDLWKLIDEGEGYYSLISAVGDGGTYALDIAGKKTADGTNADIYQYNGGDNQKFMLTANPDGSYLIRTRASRDAAVVEIANAGIGSGDNVQQWEPNGNACQKWVLNAEELPKVIQGDVNADGTFSVADVVLLQKWLLAVPETHLADWKAGDVYEDERVDVLDLGMMKRLLINS